MTHPENDPEPIIKGLAYKYQTLRCWIMNEILHGQFYDEHSWMELQKRAKKVLKETKRD